jgi:uncharacterized SAM-binding protein YcdF (DUF218 family)
MIEVNSMTMEEQQIEDINIIASFLAKRDINELNQKELRDKFNMDKADLLILLGNAMPYTAELTAKALKDGISKNIMVVGGIGHSTGYLYDNIRSHPVYSQVFVDGRAEGDILKEIMVRYSGVEESNVIVENQSTNCGSNAVEALKLAMEYSFNVQSVILIQDPTMQLRSYASFKHEWKTAGKVQFINYAPFVPKIEIDNNKIQFVEQHIHGTWSIDRFLSLIMGEIPRLYDDVNGYGPKGKGFIEHVDIPDEVMNAHNRLKERYQEYINIRNI